MRNLHCMRLQHAYTVYSFFVYLALTFVECLSFWGTSIIYMYVDLPHSSLSVIYNHHSSLWGVVGGWGLGLWDVYF